MGYEYANCNNNGKNNTSWKFNKDVVPNWELLILELIR